MSTHIKISIIKKRSAFCPLLKCLLKIKRHEKVCVKHVPFVRSLRKNQNLKRNKEVRLAKSCRECNLKKYQEKKRALELEYQHLWIREDGSKITDPWEIVDDHKNHTCDVCRKEK